MKILYLDCGMGAAGDMLTAALLELLPDADAFMEELRQAGLPDVEFVREKAVRCGITGTHVTVRVHGEEEPVSDGHGHGHGEAQTPQEHGHGHGEAQTPQEHGHEHGETQTPQEHGHGHEEAQTPQERGHEHAHGHCHSSMRDIERIVGGLRIGQGVRDHVLAVYRLLAEAESRVHGCPVAEIHFHEVGTKDALADITAVCLLMERLAPDEVVVSPVHVGCGQVRCAHGILPVPAPATAELLKGVPIYGGRIRGELCTPTGAALLVHFADRFGDMPVMRPDAVGYGMGKKDFEAANCVRAVLGASQDRTDRILELSCNVDDMTGEEIGFAMERLYADGALEVYTVPIGMKKNRPGILIRVICREADGQKLAESIFRYTTTIGIRRSVTERYVLERRNETLATSFGEVRRKAVSGYGAARAKYEYEDLARIAREQGVGIAEVRKRLERENG